MWIDRRIARRTGVVTKTSGPSPSDAAIGGEGVAPAAGIAPHDVDCPVCGATAHLPGLRHRCSACGARFDVARVSVGAREPAQSGPVLEARRHEACPVSTIEDRSDAEHVRWLIIRRGGRRKLVTKVIVPIVFWLVLETLFWGTAIERGSVGWGLVGVLTLVLALWWVHKGILDYGRYVELILDEEGLTQVTRIGKHVYRGTIGLDRIQFFRSELSDSYDTSDGFDHCVVVYFDGGSKMLAKSMGYTWKHRDAISWVVQQLATGCALLLDVDPGQFLYREGTSQS